MKNCSKPKLIKSIVFSSYGLEIAMWLTFIIFLTLS